MCCLCVKSVRTSVCTCVYVYARACVYAYVRVLWYVCVTMRVFVSVCSCEY